MSASRPATRRLAAAVLAAALLAGCGEQTLYAQLDERQANDMVAVLRLVGIPAQKVAKEGGFAVTAPEADFAHAVRTLEAAGLPRERFDSLGSVFKREGFVSTPLEERSRLIHALSQELSHTVSSIDGVLLARVTLAVPERHPLSDKVVPSSASVLIRHRPDMDVDALVPKIKALVVNSVEGLPYESVTVVAVPAQTWTPPPGAGVGSDAWTLWLWGAAGAGALALLAALTLYARRRGWAAQPPAAAWRARRHGSADAHPVAIAEVEVTR